MSREHVADADDAAVWATDHGESFEREGRPGAVYWPRRQERRRGVTACFGSSRHEDAVGDAGVEVHVVVERRAETVAGEMPPSRERDALSVSAAAVTPDAASRSRSISSRKIFVSAATA